MPRFSLKALYRWTLAALAETAVAIPWMVAMYALSGKQAWPAALPGAWVLLLSYALAAAWEFGSPQAARGSGKGRIVAMGVGLTIVYLITFYTTPIEFVWGSPWQSNLAMAILPAAGYMWYQGAASAAEGVEYGRVYTRFGIQCIATVGAVVFLIASRAAADSRVQVLLYWSLILLFAAGLTLVVVTRERSLRQDQARLGESGTGGERMSNLLTGVVIALLLLTLLASYLLSAERLSAFFGLVRGTVGRPLEWMVDVGLLIVVRWAMIILMIFNGVAKYLLPKGYVINQPDLEPGQPTEITEVEVVPQPVADPFDWMPYLKIGLMVVGGITLAIFLLRLRRRQRALDQDPEEERVDLGLWQGLKGDLQALLGSLLKSGAAGEDEDQAAALPDDPRDPRALYRRLQAWGLAVGRPRGAAESPARYGEALAERRPEAALATAEVTEVYQQARYGARPPEPEAVKQAAQALQNLQK